MDLEEINIYHLGGAVMNAINTIQMAPAIYFKLPREKQTEVEAYGTLLPALLFKLRPVDTIAISLKIAIELNRADSTFMNHKGIIYSSSDKLVGDLLLKFKSHQIVFES